MPKGRKASRVAAKTKICVFNMYGICKKGETCGFAHSSEELRTQQPSQTSLPHGGRSGGANAGAPPATRSEAPSESWLPHSPSNSAGDLASDLAHDSGSDYGLGGEIFDYGLGGEIFIHIPDYKAGRGCEFITVKNTFLTIEESVPCAGLRRSTSAPALGGSHSVGRKQTASEWSEASSAPRAAAPPEPIQQLGQRSYEQQAAPPEPASVQSRAQQQFDQHSSTQQVTSVQSFVSSPQPADLGQCISRQRPPPELKVPSAPTPTKSQRCAGIQQWGFGREPTVPSDQSLLATKPPASAMRYFRGQGNPGTVTASGPKGIPTLLAPPRPADFEQRDPGQCNSGQWPTPGPKAQLTGIPLFLAPPQLAGSGQRNNSGQGDSKQWPAPGPKADPAPVPPPPRPPAPALPRAPASSGPSSVGGDPSEAGSAEAGSAEASIVGDTACSPSAPKSSNVKLFKTKMCAYNVLGKCNRGMGCTFAHGEEELMPAPDFRRTKLCGVWLATGKCHVDDCTFAHSTNELKRYSAKELIPKVQLMGNKKFQQFTK